MSKQDCNESADVYDKDSKMLIGEEEICKELRYYLEGSFGE